MSSISVSPITPAIGAELPSDVLLQPFRLGHLTLKNRIISTAHAPAFAEDGHPKDRYRLYHEEKAKGGTSLTIIGGSTNVSVDSPSVFGQLYAGDDSIVPWFKRLTDGVKAQGVAVMCQLTHMGRRTGWDDANWLPVVGPSGIRERAHRSVPKVAELADLDRIVEDFTAAALRCKAGGFDGVEILSHSHLLGQFLSPLVNQRTDQYGGSLDNRLRLTLDVLTAVRKAVGKRFIIGIRLTGDEGLPGGITVADSIAVAKQLEAGTLVDYLNILVGAPYDDLGLAGWVSPMGMPAATGLEVCKQIKEHTSLPIMHAGGINDVATARHALNDNAIDLVGMTRAQIADPYLVTKISTNLEDRIRPCVGLGYCVDRVNQGKDAVCGHNVASGREAMFSHYQRKANQPKTVVVIGGGPAGMEASRLAAEQGHTVHLFEAASRLGGQLNLASKGVVRKQIAGISDWLIQEIDRLDITVNLNTYAEPKDILALKPELVLVATGGLPEEPSFIGHQFVTSSWDVLSGNAQVAGKILLWDELGQHAGGVTADHLSETANELVFTTPDTQPLCDLGATTQPVMLKSLYQKEVRFITNSIIAKIEKKGNRLEVTLLNTLTGQANSHTVDEVVIENGTQPNAEVYDALTPLSRNLGEQDVRALANGRVVLPESNSDGQFMLARIGDAVASRNMHAAMLDANRFMQLSNL